MQKFGFEKIGIIIGILALAGISFFVYQSKTPSIETPATTLPSPTPNATSTATSTTFTMAEVATHNMAVLAAIQPFVGQSMTSQRG